MLLLSVALINELAVDFDCSLGDSREHSGEVAEHLGGGSGTAIRVGHCPLRMLHSSCELGLILEALEGYAVVQSHLDRAPVSRDVHHHLLRQQQLVQGGVDESLSGPGVVDSLGLDPTDDAPVV